MIKNIKSRAVEIIINRIKYHENKFDDASGFNDLASCVVRANSLSAKYELELVLKQIEGLV